MLALINLPMMIWVGGLSPIFRINRKKSEFYHDNAFICFYMFVCFYNLLWPSLISVFEENMYYTNIISNNFLNDLFTYFNVVSNQVTSIFKYFDTEDFTSSNKVSVRVYEIQQCMATTSTQKNTLYNKNLQASSWSQSQIIYNGNSFIKIIFIINLYTLIF